MPYNLPMTRMSWLLSLMAVALGPAAAGQEPEAVLFTNVRVFDGRADALTAPMNVLVQGNRIAVLSAQSIPIDRNLRVQIVEGKGQTLMPGLIDAHVHLMFESIPQAAIFTGDAGYLNVVAVRSAAAMLQRGFTSVRDLGGPVFGLKRGIDEGVVPGPRIWPSGAFISQTGGHGDFRPPNELVAAPGAFSHMERIGASVIADNPDAVRQRAREQLALGASQVKLMAGGGVSSDYDPLDVSQYTVPELRAAVEAAENWGTYVTVHAYTPRAVRQALEAGVRCIDHGQLLDEPTAALMAQQGAWWSLQPFLDDAPSAFAEGSPNRLKQLEMFNGTDLAYALAKKHGIKLAWGTDVLFSAESAAQQGRDLAKMTRWYTPAEALRMATSGNAELLAMSGKRSSYEGPVGVVEAGALADLILVAGNPLADLNLVADPARNFVLIMKDGRIVKK